MQEATRQIRYDYGLIQKSQRNADGSLRTWATVSHVGALKYVNPTGTTRIEYVDKEALFEPRSLNTLAGIPFVSPHSKTLIPDRSEVKGAVLSQHVADHDQGALLTDIVIWDPETIKAIEEGKITGLSLGYKCDLERRADGNIYQVNREYYHLAGVSAPRAINARFHLDEADIEKDEIEDFGIPVMNGVIYHAQKRMDGVGSCEEFLELGRRYRWDRCSEGKAKGDKGRGGKMRVKIDEIEAEVDSSIGELLQALISRVDTIAQRLAELVQDDDDDTEDDMEQEEMKEEDVERISKKDRNDEMRAIDALRGELDALRAIVSQSHRDREDSMAAESQWQGDSDSVAAKIRLIAEVAPLLPDYRVDDLASMPEDDIKRLAITAMSDRFDMADLKSRSHDAIHVIYETLSQHRVRSDDAHRRSLAEIVRQDGRGIATPGSVSAAAHAKFAANYKTFLQS